MSQPLDLDKLKVTTACRPTPPEPLACWELWVNRQFAGHFVARTAGQAKTALQQACTPAPRYANISAKLYRCPYADELIASHALKNTAL